MAYTHQTTRKFESVLFEGVVVELRKMTEGRRMDLRKRLQPHNTKCKDLLREIGAIEKAPEDQRDFVRYTELNDEFDQVQIEHINPEWLSWGVKKVEGLIVDGRDLGVEDWRDWPSALFDEVLKAIKFEAELNGEERKNLESPTTSGAQEGGSQNSSTAQSADEKGTGTGTDAIADTSRIM